MNQNAEYSAVNDAVRGQFFRRTWAMITPYWRKSDPGPRLPWRCLFEAGIGAWFDESTRGLYQRRFSLGLPPEVEVERAFQRYGYKPAENRRAFELRTRAFQMHFRSRNYGGVLDGETCAILYALNERYRAA